MKLKFTKSTVTVSFKILRKNETLIVMNLYEQNYLGAQLPDLAYAVSKRFSPKLPRQKFLQTLTSK